MVSTPTPDKRDTVKAHGTIRARNVQNIIGAAEIEFAQRGYKATSIQKIAARAGLPKANIHYYFNSKLELYLEILTNILRLWDAALNELKPEDDPATALSRYIHAKIEFSRRYPLASRIFALEVMTGGEHLRDYYQQGYHTWFQERCAVLQSWVKQGKMAPVDPAHLIFLLWSSTQHYADFGYQATAALHGDKQPLSDSDYQQAATTLSTIILRGCGITPPDSASPGHAMKP